MTSYYIMDCWGLEKDEPTQVPLNGDFSAYGINWFLGQPFTATLPKPITLQWDPEISGGGDAWEMFGEPTEGPKNAQGVRRQWAYPTKTPPLYHVDFVAALREAGIDNLADYPVEIVEANTGQKCVDYVAVNIIGLVRAVDMSASDAQTHNPPGLIDTDFDSVTINETFVHGLKLFRLAESVNAVLVHRSVKEHLESRGGFGMTFTVPEKWVG